MKCHNHVRVRHCPFCDDEGWVCENHLEQPLEDRTPADVTEPDAMPEVHSIVRTGRAAQAPERVPTRLISEVACYEQGERRT